MTDRTSLQHQKEGPIAVTVMPSVAAPENIPEIPSQSPEPTTPTAPPTVPAHTEVELRPIRNRQPPSYLKDYVCD